MFAFLRRPAALRRNQTNTYYEFSFPTKTSIPFFGTDGDGGNSTDPVWAWAALFRLVDGKVATNTDQSDQLLETLQINR